MNEHSHKITAAADASRFALAGKATFTIVSKATGVRFTYKVKQAKDSPNLYFVQAMTGPDNESSFSYIGTLRDGFWAHGRKSKISAEAQSVRAFAWAWANIHQGKLPDVMEFWHEGKCGRCNRKLTVPESIANGIGPECIQLMGRVA